MTTTRTAYRIGAPCDGDDCFWQVIETVDGFGARIETPDSHGADAIDIDGTPDILRAIAAALVSIADYQECYFGEEAADAER
tara:strand:- start:942 stop:1187 length:246 start_codon:yes stop_codon:yes gene_type:complete